MSDIDLDRYAADLPTATPCSVCRRPSRARLVAWVLHQKALTGARYDSVLANGDHPIVLCDEHADMAMRAMEALFAPIARGDGGDAHAGMAVRAMEEVARGAPPRGPRPPTKWGGDVSR